MGIEDDPDPSIWALWAKSKVESSRVVYDGPE